MGEELPYDEPLYDEPPYDEAPYDEAQYDEAPYGETFAPIETPEYAPKHGPAYGEGGN